MTSAPVPIRPKDRDGILQALAAGVVPRAGLRHIQVGRAGEIGALVKDIDRIADGGAAIRFALSSRSAASSAPAVDFDGSATSGVDFIARRSVCGVGVASSARRTAWR